MTNFNAIEMVQVVADILAEVLRGRNACETEFARGLHTELSKWLSRAIESLAEEVVSEQGFAADRGTPEGDFLYEIYHVKTVFEHDWIDGGPFSLLDDIHEHIPFPDGGFHTIGREHTLVPSEELEGLDAIIATLREKTGMVFVVARV